MNKQHKPILVTQSFMPPMEEYQTYLNQIWESKWLTNSGPLVQQFEQQLKELLGVKHVFFTSNGTIALQLAIKALALEGEIITTPFSYVASTSSVLWENCTPVFADIDENTFCLDPEKVEKLITDKTVGILPVHVFGIPCDLKAFQKISEKYHLPIIYDAAHAFMTGVEETSVFNFGTVSAVSFHATKLFHTGEGGALMTNDDELEKKISLMRSFGHVGDDHFSLGINGKNSEFHAALGLTNFKYIDDILTRRRAVTHLYDFLLQPLMTAGKVKRPYVDPQVKYNYAYYPLLFETPKLMQTVIKQLNENNIFPRRYFFPSLNNLPYVKGNACPISESVSEKIVCLPLYFDLDEASVKRIVEIINKTVTEN